MSHEVETALYVRKPGWHGLGTVVQSAPTISEAIKLAGLNWKVSLHKMVAEVTIPGHETFSKKADTRMVIRESDGSKLGEVGPSWHPLQNDEAFEWFQPFVDNKEAEIEAAGSLMKGKRIWILAKLSRDPVEIVPGDVIRKYILLANGHDDTFSCHGGFSGVRVECNNMLMMALNRAQRRILKVRHSKNIKENLESIRETMNLANAEFETTFEQYKSLTRKQINPEDLKKYIRLVFKSPQKEEEPEKISEKKSNEEDSRLMENKIVPLFELGGGNRLPGVRGTLWAGFNAITEFLTHYRGRTDDARINSLWFGQAQNGGRAITQRALNVALEMLK